LLSLISLTLFLNHNLVANPFHFQYSHRKQWLQQSILLLNK